MLSKVSLNFPAGVCTCGTAASPAKLQSQEINKCGLTLGRYRADLPPNYSGFMSTFFHLCQ